MNMTEKPLQFLSKASQTTVIPTTHTVAAVLGDISGNSPLQTNISDQLSSRISTATTSKQQIILEFKPCKPILK